MKRKLIRSQKKNNNKIPSEIFICFDDNENEVCQIECVDFKTLLQFEKSNATGFEVGNWFVAERTSGSSVIIHGPFISSEFALEWTIEELGVQGIMKYPNKNVLTRP